MSLIYAILIIIVAVLAVYLICLLLKVDTDTRNIFYILLVIVAIIWILKGYAIQ
jgi:bacteriorhodopsin